ncbi:GNAT family N-acetyltransferase [Aquihabitans sp. G128]|uniref:GNAT family N-acetyltransferase n=1 Tax=Aquihabitans sp. G128 TaxID=2849779 RepID=UPI001C250CE7|nr:GNAT family N-acetyltransferase [Aquihabitans sp. G128]QXC62559.1 GNAT family N-acetyltransferase [Aquihabitans sp. G128]
MSAADPTAPEPPRPTDATGARTGRLLDEVAANATVAPLTRLVDGWLCKAAPDLPFRRANAVLPAAAAGADLRATAAALDVIEAWYRSFGQRVLVQVSSADPAGAALDEQLARRGYVVEAPVDLLVGEVERVAEGGGAGDAWRVAVEAHALAGTGPFAAGGPVPAGSEPPVSVVVDEGVSVAWARRYGAVHGEDAVWRARTEAYGRMLGALGPSILGGAALVGDDVVAGVGFAVLERGWAGIYGMGTAPAWRRMGVARALLAELAEQARERFATHLYLQVERDNPGAQALYRGLGFTDGHGYHYRASAPA